VAAVKQFSIEAPAKINLHLEILGKREDGFHDLRSLFQMTTLRDSLTFTLGLKRNSLSIEGDFGFDREKNTISRAVELFRGETAVDEGIAVRVIKRIPLGGGLGGGSSDAAGALRLLNRAFGHPLSEEKLSALGEIVGSDVPFFLRSPLALVEGRGERVLPLARRTTYSYLLVVPSFSINTAEAYRLYDELPVTERKESISREYLIDCLLNKSPGAWDFFNSFSAVLFPCYPFYGGIQEELSSGGALFAGLSGSGSSYFGIFNSEDEARACGKHLHGRFALVTVIRPLEELPPVIAC
jgi:4-diphosphocytidyl-2-C-methyl-D-erythritol kinase